MRLRVACVQFNPLLGQIESNLRKIRSLLADVSSVDFVVLPELAVTGYNFASRDHIRPFLEQRGRGKTFELARDISTRLRCFTLAGYPEVDGETIYNSAVLVGPNGSELHNYRKTFLYETDEVWGCSENPDRSFSSIELVVDKEYYLAPQPDKAYRTVTTNFGICMDLNPYKFEAPFNEFEMSMACFANQARLILCPMAWLSSASPSLDETMSKSDRIAKAAALDAQWFRRESGTPAADSAAGSRWNWRYEPSSPETSTVNYWILRFFPFLNHPRNMLPKNHSKVALVTCNRTGIESDVLYAGSSSIIQFHNVEGNHSIDDSNPSVQVLASLGTGEEAVVVRDVEVD